MGAFQISGAVLQEPAERLTLIWGGGMDGSTPCQAQHHRWQALTASEHIRKHAEDDACRRI